MKTDSHDNIIKAGIDAVISSNEESWEDFCSSFLNPVDASLLVQMSLERRNIETEIPPRTAGCRARQATSASKEKPLRRNRLFQTQNDRKEDQEDVEELDLGEENRSGGICGSSTQRPSFDNYFDSNTEEEDEEEEEMYFPSIVAPCSQDGDRVVIRKPSASGDAALPSSDTEDVIVMSSSVTSSTPLPLQDPCLINEEPQITSAVSHTTMLDASLLPATSSSPPPEISDIGTSENVEPFSLDETFDYDNVRLSTKHPIHSDH